MEPFSILWEKNALDEYLNIYDFLSENSSIFVADKVSDKINDSIELISNQPEIGKAVDKLKNVRQYIIRDTSHIVYYIPDKERSNIKIIKILHSRQKL